jgi:hypothetical protein
VIDIGRIEHVLYTDALDAVAAAMASRSGAILPDDAAATIAGAWAAPSNPNLTSLAQRGTAHAFALITEIIREQAHDEDRAALNALIVWAARREWV